MFFFVVVVVDLFCFLDRKMNNDMTKHQTPSQDAQGRWYELLSPTQVLTDDGDQNDQDEGRSIQVRL